MIGGGAKVVAAGGAEDEAALAGEGDSSSEAVSAEVFFEDVGREEKKEKTQPAEADRDDERNGREANGEADQGQAEAEDGKEKFKRIGCGSGGHEVYCRRSAGDGEGVGK